MTDRNDSRWMNITDVELPPIDQPGFKSAVLKRKMWKMDSDYQNIQAYITRLSTNERIYITKNKTVLGKGDSADYKLEGNSAISREHAVFIRECDEFYIEDLNSLNHTYVEGKRINEKNRLSDSNVIEIADEKFIFCIDR